MYRDETQCDGMSTRPYAVWRPAGSWVVQRRGGGPRLAFRVRCVTAAQIRAEQERCARYNANTYETRTQCWTAGCAVDAQHLQCRPRTGEMLHTPTPHTGPMAVCAQHKDLAACENEPNYMCRFDHGTVCVPNNVPHVPLHMQRRAQRVHRVTPPPRNIQADSHQHVFQRRQHVRLRVAGAPATGVVREVRAPSTRGARGLLYRVRPHGAKDRWSDMWVYADQIRAMPPAMDDPYRLPEEAPEEAPPRP